METIQLLQTVNIYYLTNSSIYNKVFTKYTKPVEKKLMCAILIMY